MTALWVALAGGTGAGMRYLIDAGIRPRVSPTLPWSTFVINVSGSLLLGLIIGANVGDTWLTVAGTGFLGGYTTFSTASVETVHLAIDRHYGAAFVNAFGMLVVSVGAAALGYAVGRA